MIELTRREMLTVAAATAVGLALSTTNAEAKAIHPATLPATFHPNDIILFQGDSITDGGRQREGMDYNHIMGQDYGYIIAGRVQSQFPEANLTFLNRGCSGNTISDLAARWQSDTLDLKPALVSILVGVNDANQTLGKVAPAVASAQYLTTYDTLIQQTLSALPGIRIVLCQPFVLPVGARKDNYGPWRAQVGAMQTASEQLATKYKLPYVKFGAMMDSACNRASADHWSWDGIHPTYAGHYLMHELWLETLNAFYAKA